MAISEEITKPISGNRLPDHCSSHGNDGEFQFQYAYWPDHDKPQEWTRLCDHFHPDGWLALSDRAFSINSLQAAVTLWNQCQNNFSSNGYSYRFRVVDRQGNVVIPDDWIVATIKDGRALNHDPR